MASAKMTAKLNEQAMVEFGASHAYLAMACAFDRMGLKALCARFLKQQEEEHGHAMKFIRYMMDIGATIELGALTKPKGKMDSAKAIVEQALANEIDVTRRIHEIAALAEEEKDFATRNFIEWFIKEQVEEEATMRDLLRYLELAGTNLLLVDNLVRHGLANGDD